MYFGSLEKWSVKNRSIILRESFQRNSQIWICFLAFRSQFDIDLDICMFVPFFSCQKQMCRIGLVFLETSLSVNIWRWHTHSVYVCVCVCMCMCVCVSQLAWRLESCLLEVVFILLYLEKYRVQKKWYRSFSVQISYKCFMSQS